ncbi:MAG TPA: ATP-binding protein [Bacilli bacterium]|nr:MAG: hypothetical protein BWY97_01338 [Tenericutes bacterium ADurb.BinA124]HPX84453.1 ATP-binding protein [Bacilli bacterium]
MYIKRDEYLKKLISSKHNKLIKVITGVRRCGKSFLLNEIFYNYLIESGVRENHIIRVSLETIENKHLRDALTLNNFIKSQIKDNNMYYIILDEIQLVDEFVDLLNGFISIKNFDVYVTGSNSKFLSSDIVTEFRGRGYQIHVSPLSFYEFYNYKELDFETALSEYLHYGGLPNIAEMKTPEEKENFLKNLNDTIYLKDIIERNNVINQKEIGELFSIVASYIGRLTNPKKLSNSFKSVSNITLSPNTISKYLDYFLDSFLISKSLRYDLKGKKYINTPFKLYFTDLGLRNARLGFRQYEEPQLMENLIYNELIIRGFNVDVGIVEINEKKDGKYIKKQLEIDFVARKGRKQFYLQSSYIIYDSQKHNQEIRPLINVNDSFKKILIVKDKTLIRNDDYGIITMGLKDFLLNKDILETVY